ncbi:putative neutral ceramidase C [Glandiceps talaboti]
MSRFLIESVLTFNIAIWYGHLTVKNRTAARINDDGAQLYQVGIGIADITGPAGEVGMMGYAKVSQVTKGIHLRLYSRAYIVADHDNPDNRIVFINTDIAMGSQVIRLELMKLLEADYAGMYTMQNVVFSAQHTHSGPGGYQQYLLYDITTLGFISKCFEAIRDGIKLSIDRAHADLQPGYIYSNRGELVDPSGQDIHWANRNRSPFAYEANPQEERDKYEHDVDKTMTLLKFIAEDGKDLGALSWFAVHPTSMNNTNHLISGDNKGYASYLMEQHFNDGARPGKGPFVAAFAQSNQGDVTPNTKDPHCHEAGEDSECEYETSSCPGQDVCVAFGPGEDIFESTEIIGRRQYDKAMELYKEARTPLSGKVDFRHQFVDMSDYEVVDPPTGESSVKTCKPAMGYSFAAGTVDGPGAFNFTQGDTTGDPFWDSVRDFLREPTEELKDCQAPKPVLLPTGEATSSWEWHPTIVDTQIVTIGSFAILAMPGEYSTMAGRRLRDAIKQTFIDNGFPEETEVVIAGLCNVYTHYIVTYEEYLVQRYEAASMIYGPHTGHAYKQQYSILAAAIATGESLDAGPDPPNYYEDDTVWGLEIPVIVDDLPPNGAFGRTLIDAEASYLAGERVSVTFQSGNPRNDYKMEGTYLEVERSTPSFDWETVYTDGDWCTRFYWNVEQRRTLQGLVEFLQGTPLWGLLPIPDTPPSLPINLTLPENFTLPIVPIPGTGESTAEIVWDIPSNTPSGTYRICHYGHYAQIEISLIPPGAEQIVEAYTGCSRSFEVTGKEVSTSPLTSANRLILAVALIATIIYNYLH